MFAPKRKIKTFVSTSVIPRSYIYIYIYKGQGMLKRKQGKLAIRTFFILLSSAIPLIVSNHHTCFKFCFIRPFFFFYSKLSKMSIELCCPASFQDPYLDRVLGWALQLFLVFKKKDSTTRILEHLH